MSMNTKRTDAELARAVRDAVSALNQAMRDAYDAGLLVQIESTPYQTIGHTQRTQVYRAEVWRSV